jgi:lactoylglutathione lyase
VTGVGITGVRTISIPVNDQDAALRFYVETLGFSKRADAQLPNGKRWIELVPGGGDVVVTLEPSDAGVTRGEIAIRFTTDDAEATYAAMTGAGVHAEEILRWPGVPPMFAFRDPDGNTFSVTETT